MPDTPINTPITDEMIKQLEEAIKDWPTLPVTGCACSGGSHSCNSDIHSADDVLIMCYEPWIDCPDMILLINSLPALLGGYKAMKDENEKLRKMAEAWDNAMGTKVINVFEIGNK